METGADPVQKIATAVLYEGYVLWPYRRSAIKNQQRWTIGGVYPPAYSALQAGSDPCAVGAECLVRGDAPVLRVTLRFLHVVERQVLERTPDGALTLVDELCVGGERYLAWEEATEREVTIADLRVPDLGDAASTSFQFPAGSERESLVGPDGTEVGALLRRWRAVEGSVEVGAVPLAPDLARLHISVRNTTPWQTPGQGNERESALRQTLVSAHVILRVAAGTFVSVIDPPDDVKPYAEQCAQDHLWPVLVGEGDARETMLAAPIILYDYPEIAPESPGDLFDGTEIDQLLTVSILTLTDEEKAEMRATDPRTRAILERTEALTTDDFLRLHGAIREFQVLRPGAPSGTPTGTPTDAEMRQPGQPGQLGPIEPIDPIEPFPTLWGDLITPAPERVSVGGITLARGSKVRLRPRPGGDIFDLALAGEVATIESIQQDDAGTLHVAVTVERDPGNDLGQERQIGHRFFFALDEIEPMEPTELIEEQPSLDAEEGQP